MNLETFVGVCVSTAHMSQQDSETLQACADQDILFDDTPVGWVSSHHHGYYLKFWHRQPDEKSWQEDAKQAGLSPEFIANVLSILILVQGCTRIDFDQDGPLIEGLTEWVW